MKKYRHLLFYCALIAILIIFANGISIFVKRNFPSISLFVLDKKFSFAMLADKVIAVCKDNSYRPGCYDKEIPKLMDKISMEDAFSVTKIVQQKDPQYWYCHVLGHNISSRETAKDPTKWKEVIPRCPVGMCSNGCIHGALQERFRKEKFSDSDMQHVLPDLADVCDEKPTWHPTGMEQATCYHALGHLLMYLTDADTKKSVDLCEKIAQKSDGRDFLTVCYDGLFMQLFQPLEPEDFALVKGKTPSKETLELFCSMYASRPQASCWSEGWPLYADQVKTPDGLVTFCSVLEKGVARDRCYNGMFFVLAAQFHLDTEKIVAFCRDIIFSERGRCFANGAGRMIETDTKLIDASLTICARAQEAGVGDECYKELVTYSRFNFSPHSEGQKQLCKGMPRMWQADCGWIDTP